MSLIKCPECGKEVSDKAPACIHCGYPLQNQQPIIPDVGVSKKVIIPTYRETSQTKIPCIKIVREVMGTSLA